MSELHPPGMVTFQTALAKMAETYMPERWSAAPDSERRLLAGDEVPESFAVQMAIRRSSLVRLAYDQLRPMLASGILPALLRMGGGPPQSITAISWTASTIDRLDLVLAGQGAFRIADGAITAGSVLIRDEDLTAVLKGEPAPSIANSVLVSGGRVASKNKGGRPNNPDADAFWIEVCRLVTKNSLPRTQAGYTAHMAQWAVDNMDRDYSEETIRKKMSELFQALAWK